MNRECIPILVSLIAPLALGQDDTLDWLMDKRVATAPASQPATRPAASPLTRPSSVQSVAGSITLSSGETLTGQLSTTPGKPLRIWVEQEHQYIDLALEEIREIRASVLWEREEREWHFIASGSDVKEYTGKTYPAREMTYTFITRDGREITGGVVAPLYLTTRQEQRTLVLNKRAKGQVGQTLADLVYVKQVSFSEGP